MKTKLLTLKLVSVSLMLILTAVVNIIKAQTLAQYSFAYNTLTYAPLDKNNSTYLTFGDENVSAIEPIGFNFTYLGSNYTNFSASSNGFIQLGSAAITGLAYVNNLSGINFTPVIAPFWDDLDATDSVWYELSGSAPNRILSVEWKAVRWNFLATDSNYAFKLQLHETTNVIDFHYGTSGISNLPSATIGMNFVPFDLLSVTPGIGGLNATTSTAVSDNNIIDFPGNGLGYQYTFSPPTGDFSPPSITNISTDPSSVCSPVAVDVTATITDSVSGVNSANLIYSVNGAAAILLPLTLSSGDTLSGTYIATIPVQAAASSITYYIEAADNLGNADTTSANSFSYSQLTVDAGSDQTINSGTTATLSAVIAGGGNENIVFSEVVLYRDGIGATPFYPSYIDVNFQDFIEITNLNSSPINLGGYTIEAYDGLNLERSYSIPATLVLPANGVAVIHFGPGTDDVANNFYNTGGIEDYYFSGSISGFVLKNANNLIVDVVASNSYVFPASSGVTPADWSGNAPQSAGFSGLIRSGMDNNTASNWSLSDVGFLMSLGSLNTGLIPTPVIISTIWNPGGATTQTFITNPLTTTTTYTVTVSDGLCSVSDSVIINVVTPVTPIAGFYASSLNTLTNIDVSLFDTSLNIPDTWQWVITPGNFTYVNSTNASVKNPVVQFSQQGLYTVQLIVTNAAGVDSVTKIDYISVALNYCTPTYTSGTSFGDYIKGVRLGTIDNWPTINDTISYHDYYGSYSTTLLAANTYTLALWNGQYPNENIAAWIDYNDNGLFDVNELLGEVNAADSLDTVSIVFTTPAIINVASARLRIRLAWNTIGVDPCLNYGWGEAEDYRVDFTNCITLPAVNLGNDTTICGVPFSLNLDAGNNGYSYVWQNGFNGQVFNATNSGTYVVDVTNVNGCHGRDSITVTGIAAINPNASFNYNSNNLSVTFINISSNATSYFWLFGDGNSSTLPSPTHTYTATGQYTVTLIATNSCGADTQSVVINVTNVGIDDLVFLNNEVMVVPNPSNGLMNLKFELLNTETINVTLYNALGEKIAANDYKSLTGKQNIPLDLTAFPKGIYTMKLSSDSFQKVKLIVIQ